MKKLSLGITVFSILFLALTFSIAGLTEYKDVKEFPACVYCGMNRGMFDYSRMLVDYEDGMITGTCSLHCTVIDMALKINSPLKQIMVGDYNTHNLINAESANWVIGGAKSGVMSKRAKWAFENISDAEAFIKENGGTKTTFDEAVRASFEDMYEDLKMIREKRQMKNK